MEQVKVERLQNRIVTPVWYNANKFPGAVSLPARIDMSIIRSKSWSIRRSPHNQTQSLPYNPHHRPPSRIQSGNTSQFKPFRHPSLATNTVYSSEKALTNYTGDIVVPLPIQLPLDEYNLRRSQTAPYFCSTTKIRYVSHASSSSVEPPPPISSTTTPRFLLASSLPGSNRALPICGERYTITPHLTNPPSTQPISLRSGTSTGQNLSFGSATPRPGTTPWSESQRSKESQSAATSEQMQRFKEGCVSKERTKTLKRMAELVPHRMNRMYYMMGSQMPPKSRYSIDQSEITRIQSLRSATASGKSQGRTSLVSSLDTTTPRYMRGTLSSADAVAASLLKDKDGVPCNESEKQSVFITEVDGHTENTQNNSIEPTEKPERKITIDKEEGKLLLDTLFSEFREHLEELKYAKSEKSSNELDKDELEQFEASPDAEVHLDETGSNPENDATEPSYDIDPVETNYTEPDESVAVESPIDVKTLDDDTPPGSDSVQVLDDEQQEQVNEIHAESTVDFKPVSVDQPPSDDTDLTVPNQLEPDENNAEIQNIKQPDSTENQTIINNIPNDDIIESPSQDTQNEYTGIERRSSAPVDSIQEKAEPLLVSSNIETDSAAEKQAEVQNKISAPVKPVSKPSRNIPMNQPSKPWSTGAAKQPNTIKYASGGVPLVAKKVSCEKIVKQTPRASTPKSSCSSIKGKQEAKISDDNEKEEESEEEEESDELIGFDQSIFKGLEYNLFLEATPDKRARFRSVTRHLVVAEETATGFSSVNKEILYVDPNLLPQQSAAFLQLFDRLDTNSDGRILIKDLQPSLFSNLKKSELPLLFRVFDLNGDKTIDSREFLAVAALNDKLNNQVTTDPNKEWNINLKLLSYYITVYKEMFQAVDINNDGRVGLEELMVIIAASLDESTGTDIDLMTDIMQSIDRDGNGYIEFVEYLTYIPFFLSIHQRLLKKPMLIEDVERARYMVKVILKKQRHRH